MTSTEPAICEAAVRGFRISYMLAGEQGPAVLLLHGSHRSSRIFRKNIPLMAQWSKVWAPDRPGYGMSDPVVDLESLPDMTEFVADFIDKVVGESVIVFGESRGGGIALETAAKYADRISGLILSSPVALPPNELPKPAETEAASSWEWFVERSVDDPAVFDDDDRQVILADLAKAREYEQRRSETVGSDYNAYGLVAQIVNVFQPVLLLWGRQDPVFPVESVVRFQELLPNLVRVEVIDDARHLCFFEHPIKVDSAIRAFVKEIRCS